MNGIYLYCVRQSPSSAFKVKGIGGSSVFTVPYKDIEAVVSGIDIEEINIKEITRKAKEDLGWIIAQSKIHEKVIEHAMGIVNHKSEIINLKSVIPMKFGTIFERPQNLEEVLKKEYQKFKKLLKNLESKQEWSVKVYVKESVFKEEIKRADKSIMAKLKRASKMVLGMDYFGELEVEKDVDNVMSKKLNAFCRNIYQSLKASALQSKENRILKKDFAGKDEPMVLNGAFLIEWKQVKNFIKKVEKLKRQNRAFIFERTGPWPPYNFCA